MVEKPIVVLPLLWSFAPNALPQPLQNLIVKLAIDVLTKGYEFLVDNSLDVEKKDQHVFDIAANLTRFFFCYGEFGDFHCDDCSLVSGS
jgi:hypothetical protein